MIDLIEYIVAEFQSKRLAMADAAALLCQLRRSSNGAKESVIHPLLHRNVSILSEQRYSSTFRGDEFFLVDHQVKPTRGASQKVLPGMAYLEMARAALVQSVPPGPEPTVLELQNVVWAQPLVLAQFPAESEKRTRQVSIALGADDNGEIDYEISSEDAEEEIVHCQGHAVWSACPPPAPVEIEQLRRQMGEGLLEPAAVYAGFARMGLIYGPSFQGITAIHRGAEQVLAEIRLPRSLEEAWGAYVLHPSLMDSALQAAVGLIGDLSELASEPRLPFALDLLRVVSPCTREMVAWVRHSPARTGGTKVVKLDVDLCDERGNVCVQMQGVTTRVLRHDQLLVVEGSVEGSVDAPRTGMATVGGEREDALAIGIQSHSNQIVVAAGIGSESLAEKTQDYFRRQFSRLLKVPSTEIDPQAALERYGIDSILAMRLTNQLEATFGTLSKTLFFEYQTIRELTDYFIDHHSPQLIALFATTENRVDEATPSATQGKPPFPATPLSNRRTGRRRGAAWSAGFSSGLGSRGASDSIAIIGLSGRYPEAVNLEMYWENLREGRDCIKEVPTERWDWREYFSADRAVAGQHYSKWGGFIEGVDEFDPSFFNMSPFEAEITDPQERLFLQHAWMAVEDAGYTRAALQVPHADDLPGQVGVYVGLMWMEYQLFGAEAAARGRRVGIVGSAASIANRVSYALNLHGPSITLDTMCSSSLTAVHTACQDLKEGRICMAIAGGVNVTIHPNKYLVLSAGQFISSDGHCQSFGEGGDGYIPGEGVGAVVLKRLTDAKRDGDHIYGIIRGSALTHGGKTNGYSVPNPQAQASAIRRALADANVDARHISYVEAHGTGTKLGDPIEIAALSKAFRRYTEDCEFCLIGSAKSNIGHCESAAGIAGLSKVLLQMQHQQIAPSLHSTRLNPNIDFPGSPFIVNQSLTAWEQPVVDGRTLPRIAGISSFGAGGSNVHMIVEEYPQPVLRLAPFAEVVIVLSARTPAQLRQKACDLLDFVRRRRDAIDLVSLAYTLQTGREGMEQRLGFVASSTDQFLETLQSFVSDDPNVRDVYRGEVKRANQALSLFRTDADLQQTIDRWFANQKFSKLLELWVNGLEVEWGRFYGEARPQRIGLPTYPFARERYWIDVASAPRTATNGTAVLHPLVHSNTSDLTAQRYRAVFTGDEFFLADHQVKADGQTAQKVLPGVAYLEMARVAIEQALPAWPEGALLELHDTAWAQPLVVSASTRVNIALSGDGDRVAYEVSSGTGDHETVHCQGSAILSSKVQPAALDLAQLMSRMGRGELDMEAAYAACARMGLLYGPAFRGVTAIHRGNGEVLAQLRLPAAVVSGAADYVLHPSLLDGALQAAVGLLETGAESSQFRLPFALETLRIVAPCTSDMMAWMRYAAGSQPSSEIVKLDVDLCDGQGNVCVQMRGFSARALPLADRTAKRSLIAVPVWGAMAANADMVGYVEHHVILCELPAVDVGVLSSLVPYGQCLSLRRGDDKNIAERYSEHALACFERIRAILLSKPEGKVLVQIIVAGDEEQVLLGGLSGLLKTARLENPNLVGQLVLVPASVTVEALAQLLVAEKSGGDEPLIRHHEGVRQVVRWQEIGSQTEASPAAFKDHGVYLITGGLGGLGVLFANDVLGQTDEARVVLTGRAALSAEKRQLLEGLAADARLRYEQVDLGDLHQVEQLIAGIHGEYGRLNGILHSAGMISDNFILNKTGAEFGRVLEPKVTGTFHLDLATAHIELDFFVLFSSLAGAMGNPGQADYAAANGFMDQFAAHRNLRVAAGQRHGRTRSINWPLWQAGGMAVNPATRELMEQVTGLQPMQTATGLDAFRRGLALPHDQILVAEGDLTRLRRAMFVFPSTPYEPEADSAAPTTEEMASLTASARDYLRAEFSEVLKLPAYKIDPDAPLENYGIDSILAMMLTSKLEGVFGPLSKTLFFEYQTIAALAGFFAKAHSGIVREKLSLPAQQPTLENAGRTSTEERRQAHALPVRNRFSGASATPRTEIAIVGLAGRYPQAETLQEFWRNLQEGRDSITEIPLERWDHARYFDPGQNRAGKTYSKWGGFLSDVDKFDPLFFNISPKEAAWVDPQERLFLETAWETIEDAGYTRQSISGGRVGVYVGVMYGQYELFGAEAMLRGDAAVPVSSFASIANRVSYFFDLHGPSLSLDTMCSSSLTTIHLACEELRRGEIDAAIAGGVNLTIHPHKYVGLSQGKFMASDGRCRSFGAGGDGYVPGEGVGAVLLKRLDDALRDGDQIYAVIKSSTVNHGGKTNGYTVPNPVAQGELILDAVRKAGIDPKTLGYVETHGTGTSLGDPIEVAGLARVFEGSGAEKQFCPIGSVKSNIGHLESAAGIAAVTKTLLQIRHRQLVPSLHANPLNPNINFAESPFYVQTELAEWKRGASPRRAGISSFGAGGSNAHVILEEYVDSHERTCSSQSPEVFVLSARNLDALHRYVERAVAFLDSVPGLSLSDVAYTSQVGRTPMDVRLAVIASTVEDLRDKLNAWIALARSGGDAYESEHAFYGNAKEYSGATGLIEGRTGQAFLRDLMASGELEKLARLWALGAGVDWSLMRRQDDPRRVSIPTYPFARERCWFDQGSSSPAPAKGAAIPAVAPALERIEERQRTYYSVRWVSKPLVLAAQEVPAAGPILILDASEHLFLTMKERQEDGPIIWVKPGDRFEEIEPAVYSMDWRQDDQFRLLLASLEQKESLPAVVLHHSSEPCDLEVGEEVARQLDRGLYTLFALCKALASERRQAPPRMISVFSSSEREGTAPLASAIGGFFRTLTLEDPRYLAKTIDIRDASALSLAAKSSLLRDEIHDRDWAMQEIRYRPTGTNGGESLTRFVRTLALQDEPARGTPPPLPLKQNGVYLIAGGFGGLGLIFARYLAENYRAKLVLIGRSATDAEREKKVHALTSHGAEVLCLQADVSKLEDMEMVVRESKARFSQINGWIHAAGLNRDAYILRKTREEMAEVLAAKVYGALNADLATRDENLDFFVFFSSVAGVLGNVGQSDYAYANHFLDSFAERRNNLERAQQRTGRTLSIDWPLWAEGGMGIPHDAVALLERRTGIAPLPVRDGIQYWEDFLRSDEVQGIALYGMASRIAAYVSQSPQKSRRQRATAAQHCDSAALLPATEAYLKTLIGAEITLAPDRIDSADRLESFGIDSVMINHINARLEQDLGALPKTLLYERETVREVAKFLVEEVPDAVVALFGSVDEPALPPILDEGRVVREERSTEEKIGDIEEIAIIGIHLSYPHSAGLEEYWENLRQGRDLVDLVPSNRWDYEEFYHPDPVAAAEGKIYCKWGGFLDHVDEFDPQFFKISSAEARMIDPQERLFLESVWCAIEDSGYTRDSLRARYPKGGSADVGVFVGVTTNSYHLLAPGEWSRGNFVSPSAMPWSVANRVSYFFDFSGPSLPIDTACSSSLVAIHLACEALRSRQCQVAVAGGVNLYLHPSKYQGLCQRRALSLDGRCHSYGAGSDGFVPAEGVGTLILKPLRKAVEDNDRVYAVIRASAFDHSGRSNGYSAPNPNAQASLITRMLDRAQIDPESIGYVEGHGTGTQMGDSLEIAALTQAFQKRTATKQFCAIGSVKANLGHAESAAGIAGVTKVVLQLEHRQLVPSLHSDEPNPNIEFDETPFYLQHGLSEWPSPSGQPRRALVNAFGAGGVNACVILEEYRQPDAPEPAEEAGPYLFVLSARNEDRLRDYADRVLTSLKSDVGIDLARLCYTFQSGREAMEERLAAIVANADDLISRLAEWSARRSEAGVQRGSLGPRRLSSRSAKLVRTSAGAEGLAELASRWVAGEDVQWESLYSRPPRRTAVTTYPFARERYWVSDSPVSEPSELSAGRPHPLIAYNSSTFTEVSFRSSLSDTAFYAVDHKVRGDRIFPGAGFLEMACISANMANERKVRAIKDVVWAQPLSFRTGTQALRTVLRHNGEVADYEISSVDDQNEAVVHCEGRVAFANGLADPDGTDERIAIHDLKNQCGRPADSAAHYDAFRAYGFQYGPSFQCIQELHVNGSFALAKLKVAEHMKGDFGQFILHPSIIDGALQTVGNLMATGDAATPCLPFALDEIDLIRPLAPTCYAYAERVNVSPQAGVMKFNIRIFSESGEVMIKMNNLYVRPLPIPQAEGGLFRHAAD